VLLAALAAAAAPEQRVATSQPSAAARPATLRVGRLTLQRCRTAAPWCATLSRPLDPSGVVPGSVPVYFEYYPHSLPGPAAGTLVGAAGGPGYPTTGSADEYLALFAPLRTRYDVLLMDYRGSGRSGALDCRELQQSATLTAANIGACGRSLGRSAPFYSTVQAADDLAAVLAALGIGPISLYGDSYGTYFSQVFARRHPEHMRVLVLDAAYPLERIDYAWYTHYAPAMRDKFNRSCERAPACRAIPGSSIEHIVPALERLRARPLAARVRYGDDRLMAFTADAPLLALTMFAGYPGDLTVRETDAAARAFVAGDTLPLLRLMAEARLSTPSIDPAQSLLEFSAGLEFAVLCQDPPQIFDMRLPSAARRAQHDRLIAERKRTAPDTYAPFTIDEYRHMPLDYSYLDTCVEWPSTPGAPLVSGAPPYPSIPVLVISGEFDSNTTVADGLAAAAHYPHGHHVLIANSYHVNATRGARSDCATLLARRFLDTLGTGDESCAAAVPAVRLVPGFARSLHEVPAARAAAGNAAGEAALRVVTVALRSCEDAITRASEYGAGPGMGLRGGRFRAARAGEGYRLALSAVRWTEDVGVSGQVDWPGPAGIVHAHLELRAPGADGTLELSWPEGGGAALAHARGELGGRALVAEAPAP